MNIFGNKTLTFTRSIVNMSNYAERGVFSVGDQNVTVTNQSIFLCNNSIKIDYSSNEKDTIQLLPNTLVNYCNDTAAKDLLNLLLSAQYYRL